jgi:hypothetical protein
MTRGAAAVSMIVLFFSVFICDLHLEAHESSNELTPAAVNVQGHGSQGDHHDQSCERHHSSFLTLTSTDRVLITASNEVVFVGVSQLPAILVSITFASSNKNSQALISSLPARTSRLLRV